MKSKIRKKIKSKSRIRRRKFSTMSPNPALHLSLNPLPNLNLHLTLSLGFFGCGFAAFRVISPARNRPATRSSRHGRQDHTSNDRPSGTYRERRNTNRHASHGSRTLPFLSFADQSRLFRIIAVPVLTPLENIAVHVVQSPGVGGEAAHRRGLLPIHALLAVAIDDVAVVIGLVRGDGFAKVKRRCRSRTTGSIPTRLRWADDRTSCLFPAVS